MMLGIKSMLEQQEIPCPSKDEEILPTENQYDLNKIMWYGIVTAMTKIHKLDDTLIVFLTEEVIENSYMSQEEKSRF